MRVLTGFYVYGAMAYALIGAAAIAWHDKEAFAAVVLGASLTTVAYDIQGAALENWKMTAGGLALAGWMLPIVAAVKLVFWS